MTKNPVMNALGASMYIILVVGTMTLVTQPLKNNPDTFFAPIVMLFVFTLSAVVMAYLFFYQPVLMLIEGNKKEAVDLFVKTTGVFGIVTIGVLLLLYLGII